MTSERFLSPDPSFLTGRQVLDNVYRRNGQSRVYGNFNVAQETLGGGEEGRGYHRVYKIHSLLIDTRTTYVNGHSLPVYSPH